MATAYETAKASANQLTVDEKERLARELFDEVDDSIEPGAKEAWNTELARRIDDIKSGKVIGIPEEEVLAKIRAKFLEN